MVIRVDIGCDIRDGVVMSRDFNELVKEDYWEDFRDKESSM